jgi:hypothetical protein
MISAEKEGKNDYFDEKPKRVFRCGIPPVTEPERDPGRQQQTRSMYEQRHEELDRIACGFFKQGLTGSRGRFQIWNGCM